MVSDLAIIVFVIIILVSIGFGIWSLSRRKELQFIHRLYLMFCMVVSIWALTMIGVRFSSPDNINALIFWDSFSYVGVAYSPVFMLMITMAFVQGEGKMPRWWVLMLVIPTLTNIIVWTNPLHHLQYVVFSVIREQIVFGPYIVISGAYSYICLLAAVTLVIRFAIMNRSRLYFMQSVVFAIGELTPLIVSMVATFGIIKVSIATTPISFIVTVACHYIAIYRLHVLDIKPVATQHVLDWISDCYLILSDKNLVISNNQPFRNVFGTLFGITENRYLDECIKEEDVLGKSSIYNLLTTIESCRESKSTYSYEQAINITDKGELQKRYYIVDVIPLLMNAQLTGFVVIFKDITQMKKSMKQLQEGQTRMMEQERLAFLGQMMGGLAHNLKTPIMSISGCVSAIEVLVQESRESLGDSEVTDDDYREIYSEIDDWLYKTRDACTYMSDIISAIKGQAANASVSDRSEFTVDELFKRTALLMRHELLNSGCQLVMEEYDPDEQIKMSGDINSLIQVLNNLITNAIDAQRKTDSDRVYLGIHIDETNLNIYVKDRGSGVDPHIRDRLFREMITSKGTKGTGLGLYISNAIIRGKFGGFMWTEDNPEGGSIFGLAIPLETVTVKKLAK
jgi:Signal transduction histidine kinase regulating C4-dicarboxylate transport system